MSRARSSLFHAAAARADRAGAFGLIASTESRCLPPMHCDATPSGKGSSAAPDVTPEKISQFNRACASQIGTVSRHRLSHAGEHQRSTLRAQSDFLSIVLDNADEDSADLRHRAATDLATRHAMPQSFFMTNSSAVAFSWLCRSNRFRPNALLVCQSRSGVSWSGNAFRNSRWSRTCWRQTAANSDRSPPTSETRHPPATPSRCPTQR